MIITAKRISKYPFVIFSKAINVHSYHLQATFEECDFYDSMILNRWYNFDMKFDPIFDEENDEYPGHYYFKQL